VDTLFGQMRTTGETGRQRMRRPSTPWRTSPPPVSRWARSSP
jgi:hypothetical protein